MKQLLLAPDFPAFREAARDALRQGFRPEEIDLQDATLPSTLSLIADSEARPTGTPIANPNVPRAFLEAARFAACHREPKRWNLLYRLLFRLQTERNLLKIEADPDVAHLLRLEGQVRRDLHKMRAFVRFRKVLEPGELALAGERPEVLDEAVLVAGVGRELSEEHHLVLATPTPFGPTRTEIPECWPEIDAATNEVTEHCEHFIAWYQPDHRILPLAAPFFADRFAILRWSILTPDAAASWDPVTRQLRFSPGLPRDSSPPDDELESLWRIYYASLFNPTRILPEANAAQPVCSDANLPQPSTTRAAMVTRQQQPTAQPFVPIHPTLATIHDALPTCRGCELYEHATQVVPGFGPPDSPLMLVGEQPGDQEDLQGLPFVGPAGKLLRGVLQDLRIDPATVYMTNAVKHFKFVRQGKLRLHKSPRMSEITACRPWLEAEIAAAQPRVVLCLGASASKSLLGGTFSLLRDRGTFRATPFAERVMATLHPSAILRARDEQSRHQMTALFRDDLSLAYQASRQIASDSA